jgi:WD40 repeat protein
MNYQQRITCLSTNDDNSFLVGGSWQTIWLWRLKLQYEQIKFDGHEGWVTSVSLSKNGQYLVSSGEDNVVNVWDVQQRSLLWKNHQSQDATNAVLINSDNKLIIGGSDKTIKILDISTQKVEKILKGHSKAVTCLAISPDGRLLFSGSSDTTIKIWDLDKQEYIYEIQENRTEITCLVTDFIDEKLILVSGSSDGKVNILEVNKNIKKSNFLDRFNILKFNYKLIRSYSDFPHSIKSIIFGNNRCIGVNLKEQIKYWSYKANLSGVLASIENVNDILISKSKDYAICATDKWLKLVDLSSREIISLINLKDLIVRNDGSQIIETKTYCQFYLQATTLTEDQFNIDDLYLKWQTDRGEINSRGLFTTEEKEGDFNITVKDKFGLLELSIPIKIIKIPPYLNKLEFSDFCNILEFKQEFQFAVEGFDQYDKFFKTENIQWIVSHGQIDNVGKFSIDSFIGKVEVKAIAKDVKNNRDIVIEKIIEIVEPAKLNQLVIFPGDKNKVLPNLSCQTNKQNAKLKNI